MLLLLLLLLSIIICIKDILSINRILCSTIIVRERWLLWHLIQMSLNILICLIIWKSIILLLALNRLVLIVVDFIMMRIRLVCSFTWWWGRWLSLRSIVSNSRIWHMIIGRIWDYIYASFIILWDYCSILTMSSLALIRSLTLIIIATIISYRRGIDFWTSHLLLLCRLYLWFFRLILRRGSLFY